MKYGNMVAERDLMFSENEVRMIDESLISMAGEQFPELRREKIVHGLDGNGGESLTFVFTCPEWKGRTASKGRASFRGVTFVFYKHSGYLEELIDPAAGWKRENVVRNYESAPEFQYCCYTRAQGSTIRFRCKNSEGILPASPYVFGTEFSDISEDLLGNFRHLRNKVCCHGKFCKK